MSNFTLKRGLWDEEFPQNVGFPNFPNLLLNDSPNCSSKSYTSRSSICSNYYEVFKLTTSECLFYLKDTCELKLLTVTPLID